MSSDAASPGGSPQASDPSASASAETEHVVSEGGSYNPFEGEVVTEVGTSEPFHAESGGGVEVKDDMDWDSPPPDPGSSETSSVKEEKEEKPKKRKKKRSEDDAPHEFEEYEEFAETGIDFLDYAQDILTHWKLDKHVHNGTIHAEALDRFVRSLELTPNEKRKLRKPVAKVLEQEKVKVDPWVLLVMVAAEVAGPRIQAVNRLDKQLTKMQEEKVSIGKDDEVLYHARGQNTVH